MRIFSIFITFLIDLILELRNELHNAALQANIASLNHNAGPQGARNSAINIGDAMESTTPAGTAAARRFSSFHSHAPTQDYGHPRRQSSIHTGLILLLVFFIFLDNAFGFQGNPAPQQAADLTSLFTGSRASMSLVSFLNYFQLWITRLGISVCILEELVEQMVVLIFLILVYLILWSTKNRSNQVKVVVNEEVFLFLMPQLNLSRIINSY